MNDELAVEILLACRGIIRKILENKKVSKALKEQFLSEEMEYIDQKIIELEEITEHKDPNNVKI